MVKYGGTGEMLEDGAAEPDEGSPADKEMDYKAVLAEILAREKVIKSEWLDKTKESYEIYDGSKSDTIPFNILYSNTEILVPNLFSAAPKPVVRRRFGEMRADGASKAAERMAEYCMDTNLSGYPDFVDALESCVLDAALPGQGQARVRLVNDTAVIDYVQHDAFIWAYAKRWEDTGWIAYRHDKTVNDTKADLALEPDVAAGLKSPSRESSSSMKDKGPETIAVYEIWDKRSRMVHFCTEGHPDIVIKSMEDPLGLEGFFPSGKPLRLLSTPISTMPRSMYNLYRKQAMELNEVTRRITNLTKAIQVRGIYDGNIAEMANLFSMENSENKLTASNNPGTLLRDGGLDKHIWLVPVEKYVTVLAQLFVIRDQIKNTIYEILGIGDILRGVTKASETLGAQEIKDKWGTLRIKKSRERVSTFVRQQIRFLIEVSAKHVPEQIWAQVTGLPYVSSMEAQMQPQLPPPGPQGPPQPPQMVSWGEVLGMLKDDMQRSYRIDIESNSTVDGDATTEKTEATEFMNAIGQAIAGLAPVAQMSPQGFEVVKKVMVELCKRYRMGSDLISLLDQMQPPPSTGQSPEMQAQADDLTKREEQVKKSEDQLKSQADGLKSQADQQKAQIDQSMTQLKQVEDQLQAKAMEISKATMELELKKREISLDVREGEIKLKGEVVKVNAARAPKPAQSK